MKLFSLSIIFFASFAKRKSACPRFTIIRLNVVALGTRVVVVMHRFPGPRRMEWGHHTHCHHLPKEIIKNISANEPMSRTANG